MSKDRAIDVSPFADDEPRRGRSRHKFYGDRLVRITPHEDGVIEIVILVIERLPDEDEPRDDL